MLVVLLERRMPALEVMALVRGLGTIVLASTISGAVLWAVLAGLDGAIGAAPGKIVLAAELAAASLAGGLAYLGLALLLRIPEVSDDHPAAALGGPARPLRRRDRAA